ncbi:phosphatidylserine decarboxylase [Pseudohyphozyma bogoriensis]|nr:phosphatidylserine decarboxylase [Pseudohyphozyma bogoriensis]
MSEVNLSELLQPNPEAYPTLNEFFYRKLRPGVRPQDKPKSRRTITSAADCRLTVFESVGAAREFWIKGSQFNIANLVLNEGLAQDLEGGELAIFRLAPADYHRYHSPVDAVVGRTTRVVGDYYTVNPAAINENLDVFTKNHRYVTVLSMPRAGDHVEVAFVAIGAMLVGSIHQSVHRGDEVKRGDELGYFAYGGSTCIAIFPPGVVKWDEDLLYNSSTSLETMVRVGEKIGTFI